MCIALQRGRSWQCLGRKIVARLAVTVPAAALTKPSRSRGLHLVALPRVAIIFYLRHDLRDDKWEVRYSRLYNSSNHEERGHTSDLSHGARGRSPGCAGEYIGSSQTQFTPNQKYRTLFKGPGGLRCNRSGAPVAPGCKLVASGPEFPHNY